MAVTLDTLRKMKQAGQRIASLTAYDYSFARLLEAAAVDVVLVGDSLGNVIQGQATTVPVTLDEMVYHTRCVARGLERALLLADLPFLSYQESPVQALRSAGRLMKEGLAHMVKLEGGAAMAPTVEFLVERGVPVCGHLGLTPQSVHQLGGYKVQGRSEAAAQRLRDDALALQQAGAALLVIEAVPRALAGQITRDLAIPTIGIGAGVDCDGQVLVLQDALGMNPTPARFVRNFLKAHDDLGAAIAAYVQAVKDGSFPAAEHGYD
ncbi:MAG: 3-methyl-2-oxobutanoate hydroxymethyltransferase [Gammaproteobacteria bacterium]